MVHLSVSAFSQVSQNSKLKPCHICLNSHTGSAVKILGEAQLWATLSVTGVNKTLTLLAVEKGASLLGEDWIEGLQLPLSVKHTSFNSSN